MVAYMDGARDPREARPLLCEVANLAAPLVRQTSTRLLKKAHLRGPILRTGTPRAGALAAANRKNAWTHLRWVPRPGYPS